MRMHKSFGGCFSRNQMWYNKDLVLLALVTPCERSSWKELFFGFFLWTANQLVMVMYHRAHGQPTIGPIYGYVGHIWPCAVRWGPNSARNLQCWHIVSLLQAYMSPHCGPLSALLSVGRPQSTHIMGNPTGHIWALHFPTGLCKVWVCKPLLLPHTCPKGTGSDWEPISCLNFSL